MRMYEGILHEFIFSYVLGILHMSHLIFTTLLDRYYSHFAIKEAQEG